MDYLVFSVGLVVVRDNEMRGHMFAFFLVVVIYNLNVNEELTNIKMD
jgi:hypothetical protein